jgi:hypothetical protein
MIYRDVPEEGWHGVRHGLLILVRAASTVQGTPFLLHEASVPTWHLHSGSQLFLKESLALALYSWVFFCSPAS